MWNLKIYFLSAYKLSTRFIGIQILAAADVIRDKEATTMPWYKLDAEFAEVIFIEESLLISGNLYCCRFKKECSKWMKLFAEKLNAMA
ncbi:MAG: hypothetical protein OSB44_09215 [Verrucomicrobiales bacterium]|nr:hypothetical protein [Verrucomicrobiales bacterium]